ncbi:MAG: Trk system potassium transporter TrkA [Candidatus Aminicenantes bacterium]|nr:Trk system potassium transporter TrkA [Candidatus Aminicenantes bacterium]
MKIVIVGAGEVGFELAKRLVIENKDVILIEKNPERADYVSRQLDCKVVNGLGNNPDTLKIAGINKADFFISLTGSDEVNIIACGLVDKKFNISYRIARVKNIDYFTTKIMDKSFFGIDLIVNPEIEAAKKIIDTIESGASSDIIFFEQGCIQMRNVVVTPESFLKNMTVRDAMRKIQMDFLIAGIEKSDRFVIPSGDTVIHEEDNLYLLATKEKLERIFHLIGRPPIVIKDVVLVGGSKIGIYIAKQLIQGRKSDARINNRFLDYFFKRQKKSTKIKSLKIIEEDYEKCKELSSLFPEALVINADISDESVFKEEGLSDYDLIVTTTKNDELNILVALYAKRVGIKRAISMVNQKNYMNMASKLGIDAVVSLRDSITNPILKFIRKGNIKSIHSISGGDVEVMELSLEKKSQLTGRKIKDLNFPAHALIISVAREGRSIIPHGDLVIKDGDHVIIIAQKEFVGKIESMVAVP